MKQLTPEQREAALAICEKTDEARKGLCERDWPHYRHKKTKKVVVVKGTNKDAYNPIIYTLAVTKTPGTRHCRTSPVGALNFERDYELLPA